MNRTINTKIQTAIHRCRNASKEFFLLFFYFMFIFTFKYTESVELVLQVVKQKSPISRRRCTLNRNDMIRTARSALLALHRSLCFVGKIAIILDWSNRIYPSHRQLSPIGMQGQANEAVTREIRSWPGIRDLHSWWLPQLFENWKVSIMIAMLNI